MPDLHEPLEDLDRCPECGLFEGHKMDCSRSPRSQLRVYATRNPDGSFTADGPVTP